jgi:hypothetical protein
MPAIASQVGIIRGLLGCEVDACKCVKYLHCYWCPCTFAVSTGRGMLIPADALSSALAP